MRITTPTRRSRLAVASAAAATLALVVAGCGGASGEDAKDAAPVAKQETNQALHDKLPADVKQAGQVKVGTEALYPPFESFAEDNKTIVGLDPDLAEALGQVLGVKVVMTHTAFEGLLTALDGGRFDLVMAAITDTKARQAKYDFVDYFMTGQAIVVKKGNPAGIKGVADLCGKNVSVLTASTQQKLLGEFNEKDCATNQIKVAAFPSDKDALLQVQTGRVDASFTQDATGTYNARTIGGGNQFEIANSEPLLPVPVGIVFHKDNTELRDAFQAALKELIANGAYEQILEKHELTIGVYKDATINGGTA
jgi:polar amino acid transport system substrate-binding protein